MIPHASEAKHIMFQITECHPVKLPRFQAFNILLALWPAKISGWPKRPVYDPLHPWDYAEPTCRAIRIFLMALTKGWRYSILINNKY